MEETDILEDNVKTPKEDHYQDNVKLKKEFVVPYTILKKDEK